MDKSRQQFEEEFKKRVELPTSDIFKINDDTGEYYYMAPRQAWYWWQVSRESLEIELPDASDSDSECPNYHDGYNTAMSRAYDAITEHGVKVHE